MAYRAGAELSGFEYTLVYYIIKDINAPLLYITLTRGAHLLNAFAQEFQEDHPGIHLMHMAERGPMRIDMRHMSEEKIREVEDLLFSTERPVQERFFKGRGVDFRTGEIELWPTDCYLCGGHGLTGIRINEKGESSVPGLYAAGNVQGNRFGGEDPSMFPGPFERRVHLWPDHGGERHGIRQHAA